MLAVAAAGLSDQDEILGQSARFACPRRGKRFSTCPRHPSEPI